MIAGDITFDSLIDEMAGQGSQMKFIAIVANTEIDLDGDRFSKECLERMSQVESVPVTVEFKHEIGSARGFFVDEQDRLVCSGEMEQIDIAGLYPVVGFTCQGKHDGKYINPRLFSIGLTPEPATLNTCISEVK